MKLTAFKVCLLALSLACSVDCNSIRTFFDRHISDIENYIMTGYGYGWNQCDEITLEPKFLDNRPLYLIDQHIINGIELPNTVASSSCLIVTSQIKSNQSLSELIQFGWNVVRYKRLALVLQMSSDISLDFAKNTTGLPFLIAAQLEGGREQYLCPLIGQSSPLLKHSLCEQSLYSLKNKTLRVTLVGVMPWIGYPFEGSDPRFIEMVSEKMDFSVQRIWATGGYTDAINKARPLSF